MMNQARATHAREYTTLLLPLVTRMYTTLLTTSYQFKLASTFCILVLRHCTCGLNLK